VRREKRVRLKREWSARLAPSPKGRCNEFPPTGIRDRAHRAPDRPHRPRRPEAPAHLCMLAGSSAARPAQARCVAEPPSTPFFEGKFSRQICTDPHVDGRDSALSRAREGHWAALLAGSGEFLLGDAYATCAGVGGDSGPHGWGGKDPLQQSQPARAGGPRRGRMDRGDAPRPRKHRDLT